MQSKKRRRDPDEEKRELERERQITEENQIIESAFNIFLLCNYLKHIEENDTKYDLFRLNNEKNHPTDKN